jgi:hypothetical protein
MVLLHAPMQSKVEEGGLIEVSLVRTDAHLNEVG